MATVGDVATAISLIRKVIKAATDVKMMKKEFKELASYLELIGSQLEMLDEREFGDASMQTFWKIDEVLLQCHDLANSCQQRNYIDLVINGLITGRIANFTDNGSQSDARLFTYKQIRKMAHNFETVIGRGGSAIVYHGLLKDGTDVAIKLQKDSFSNVKMVFFNELRILTRVHHTNLISLIGYCKDRNHFAIVYEYMPGGSLHAHLRGNAGFPVLTWAQRLQIAYQVAQGLDYLHTECNPPIIHRDVKSSNILLGSDLEVKITDFGFSKACNVTYETTVVVGTFGYLDPEYFQTGHVSKASDVYGFGIILLEMITGQPAFIIGEEQIIKRISQRVSNEEDIVDRSMDGYYDPRSVRKVLELAWRCTDSSSRMRPPMAEVVIQLKEIIEMHPFKQITEDMNIKDMENEEVEEAFVTSIAQADRPLCTHQLSAILFTSWAHNAPGRRFWRCKNWKKVDSCGYFKWHDPVQKGVMIEQMDFVINQRNELVEEVKMMDEKTEILFCELKALVVKTAECKRSKLALEMKSESMDRFYGRM